MHWLQSEYILKGIYLGLLLYVAAEAGDAAAVEQVGLLTLGGLLLALLVAGLRKLRDGYQVRGRFLPFLLFLLLESPTLVYAGVLLGMAVGAAMLVPAGEAETQWQMGTSVLGGALLGILFGLIRLVQRRDIRLWLSLLLGASLVAVLLYVFGQISYLPPPPRLLSPRDPALFGILLIIGMPIFYLLTFVGRAEESEVEIGITCAGLGLGAAMLVQGYPHYRSLAFLLPVMLYFLYTFRIMPGLRVFKHTLRGMSFSQVGRHRQALLAFRRALQLDPANTLARESLWAMHRTLDLPQLVNDPQTLALVDLDMCLDRAAALLLQPGPGAGKLAEANRLLDLVLSQRPSLRPRIDYWRVVARTHAHQMDEAVQLLSDLLDPMRNDPADRQRRAVLLQAWQLALFLKEDLRQRVGLPQLALPGRRMEAIAAVERHLAEVPDDGEVWNLKRLLYQDLKPDEYRAAAATEPPAEFDHEYVRQLGLALIEDVARWQRGAEYLAMAANGLPALAPNCLILIGQAHQRAGDTDGMWQALLRARQAGRAFGPKNLPDEDRHAFFAAMKSMAEAAEGRGDLDVAVENYGLYTEYERAGVETYRHLAGLHERRGDPLSAAMATERGLVYNAKDPDLLERKDRYYYSVLPETLSQAPEAVRSAFDVDYCVKKARSLLDARGSDLDLVDWAAHLVALARIIQPTRIATQVLAAQANLRRGERDEAVATLEKVREGKPERFASADEEDAWFRANQILGKLYLDELGRADLAVPCFQDFRKSPKSGADTMFRLGQAYEQLGDMTRAVRCYEHVAAYDGHPLAPDARDAVYRLQSR